MNDKRKTKDQLVAELLVLRREVAELRSALQGRDEKLEEIKHSLGSFKVFFESAPDACFISDGEGRVIQSNAALKELTGRKGDIIGCTLHELDLVSASWVSSVDAGTTFNGPLPVSEPLTFTHVREDGRRISATTWMGPKQVQGTSLIFGMARDRAAYKCLEIALQEAQGGLELQVERRTAQLTEANQQLQREIEERRRMEKALRDSHQRFVTVLDSLDAGVYVADMETYEILLANKHAEAIFGDDLPGKICWQVLHSGQSGPCDFCTNKMLLTPDGNPGKTCSWEFQNTVTQAWYSIHDRAIRWTDGRLVRLAIVTNITPTKRMEEALCKARDQLELQVAERTADLARANAALRMENAERRQAERDIAASEARFRELFNNMTSGVAIYQVEGNGRSFIFKDFNRAGEEIIGIKREDLLGKEILEIFPGAKEFGLLTVLKRVWQTSLPEFYPISVYLDDRIHRWLDSYVYKLASGEIVALFDDATERKNAEAALCKSEARYRAIVEDQSELITRFSSDGILTFVNEAYCRYFGESPEQLIGSEFWHHVPPADREKLQSHIVSLNYENPLATIEHQVLTSSGEVRWQQWNDRALFDEHGFITEIQAVGRDITERRRTEEALRESEEKYRRLFATVPDAIIIYDVEGLQVLEVNDAAVQLYGYTRDEFVGLKVLAVSAEPERTAAAISSQSVGIQQDASVFRHRKKDGTLFPVEVSRGIFRLGDRICGCSVCRDLTEREKKDAALRQAEEKYRSIFENAVEGVFQTTPAGGFISANPALARIHGYATAEELIADVTDVGAQLYADPASREQLVRLLADQGRVTNFEIQGLRKDGSVIWVSQNARAVRGEDGEILYFEGTEEDITSQKEAEENLRHLNEKLMQEHGRRKFLSKKLIDLLEMDRQEIAMELHDHIGQVLTTLKMDLEMIACQINQTCTVPGDTIHVAQAKVVQAIKGVKDIAHGLRPSILDNLGLASSISALICDIKSSTNLDIHFFSRNVQKRFGQEQEIAIYRIAQEALNNVIKHAQAGEVFINLVARDNVLHLSVEDDGIGFQTNGVARNGEKGRLGIPIMQERVVQLGGEFSIESRVGGGTHLRAEIPL